MIHRVADGTSLCEVSTHPNCHHVYISRVLIPNMDKRTKGNIVVGAIVSFVFAAYAGGPLIGGAIAGYLEGSDLRWGIRVGAMAGIVVWIVSFVLTVENTLLGTEPYYGARSLLYGTLTRGIVPHVVLPLVGGGIGAYIRRETGE